MLMNAFIEAVNEGAWLKGKTRNGGIRLNIDDVECETASDLDNAFLVCEETLLIFRFYIWPLLDGCSWSDGDKKGFIVLFCDEQ